MSPRRFGSFPKLGEPCRLETKNYSIVGSIMGPLFREISISVKCFLFSQVDVGATASQCPSSEEGSGSEVANIWRFRVLLQCV